MPFVPEAAEHELNMMKNLQRDNLRGVNANIWAALCGWKRQQVNAGGLARS